MADWVTEIITSLGYVGIGFLMFLENLFPPIPSELIMPLAGFAIARGEMQAIPAVTAGVVGTVLGAVLWYVAGMWLGGKRLRYLTEKYGKWAGLSVQDMDRAKGWFDRYGGRTVLLCRLVPGVRTLISIPAGTYNMPFFPFFIYSTVGTLLWTVLLTYLGYLLGENYTRVGEYLGPISKIVLVSLIIWAVIWVIRRRNRE
ncbi:MAG: DedA family protein [Thainema sp.]